MPNVIRAVARGSTRPGGITQWIICIWLRSSSIEPSVGVGVAAGASLISTSMGQDTETRSRDGILQCKDGLHSFPAMPRTNIWSLMVKSTIYGVPQMFATDCIPAHHPLVLGLQEIPYGEEGQCTQDEKHETADRPYRTAGQSLPVEKPGV